jgi:hypothetical protein
MKKDVMNMKLKSGTLVQIKGYKFSQLIGDKEMEFFVVPPKRGTLCDISAFGCGCLVCQCYYSKGGDIITVAKAAVADFAQRVKYDWFQAVIAAAEIVN